MVGAFHHNRNERGYRNYYCIDETNQFDVQLMLKLMDKGLVVRECEVRPNSRLRYFHATELGCKTAGLHKAAITRAMEKCQ
jgi:hypothetical protein